MKVAISLSIPLAAIFLATPWKTQNPTVSITQLAQAPAPVAEASERPAKIWTDAATVYKGESFVLRFSAPNAPYLGIIDPNGRFFYVVFPRENAEGKLTPLVDSERFATMTSLNIHTGQLKADPYTYGIYENQPVFTCSGAYTFILGENLHVDDPALVSSVRVQYVHRPRSSASASTVAMN
ncbi:MAG: hypothetical protein RMJ33_09410 [Saprospiraceae bacterium]|nr:hypothetical protein [Saprospiraceae bacterium]MDW8230041.1 hypothetical protein [Saprospiraceae bacterium]